MKWHPRSWPHSLKYMYTSGRCVRCIFTLVSTRVKRSVRSLQNLREGAGDGCRLELKVKTGLALADPFLLDGRLARPFTCRRSVLDCQRRWKSLQGSGCRRMRSYVRPALRLNSTDRKFRSLDALVPRCSLGPDGSCVRSTPAEVVDVRNNGHGLKVGIHANPEHRGAEESERIRRLNGGFRLDVLTTPCSSSLGNSWGTRQSPFGLAALEAFS